MTAFVHVARYCTRQIAWLLPVLLAVVLACVLSAPDAPGDEATAALWLHLPAFLLVAGLATATLEAWPLMARDRPGAAWVARTRPGPLSGCGAAALAGLLVIACGLAILGAVFAQMIPEQQVRRHLPLTVVGDGFLGRAGAAVRVEGTSGRSVGALELHPLELLPTGAGAPETSQLLVVADGATLAAAPLEIRGNEPLRIDFAPRAIEGLELRLVAGDFPLLFVPGSLSALSAQRLSWTSAVVVAALTYLVPAFLALAVAAFCSAMLSLPVNLGLVLVCLLVTTLGDLGPTGEAVTWLARGRWPGDPALLGRVLPSLSAGILAIICGMLIRRSRP